MTELRTIARDATHAHAESAAFVLGRRSPRALLETILGELPERNLTAFARGLLGRAPTDAPAALGRLAPLLETATPSSVIAALVQRHRLPLGTLHGLPLRWLASSELSEQVIGARLVAAPDADSISPTLIAGLHPIALSTLTRSIKDRAPDVRHGFEAQALALVGERVALHPRAWANSLRTLLETADFDDAAVRLALQDQLPRLDGVRLEPPSVNAAFRCAWSLTADRWLTGERVMRCADGTERWRALAARAERIGMETPPRDPVVRLQAIQREAGGETRVLQVLARVATHTEGAADPTMLQGLARSTDPGVLSELLEGLVALVDRTARTPPTRRAVLDRIFTAPGRERLLRAPFELPEEATIEARTHALALLRRIGSPLPVPAGVSRAIEAAMHPERVLTPDAAEGSTGPIARLRVRTTAGSFTVVVRGDTAPHAAQVVLDAARAGRYRATTWHRVVPWFVAQGGDPRGDGYGGTDHIVRTEVNGESFRRGVVGIPLGGLDSGGMQWFVMLADAPHLDARYPVLGEVVEGMNTVDRLMIGDVFEEVTVSEP
ncbi:MAG: peptidylprolyl isomerase [Polyangiales bacterium]